MQRDMTDKELQKRLESGETLNEIRRAYIREVDGRRHDGLTGGTTCLAMLKNALKRKGIDLDTHQCMQGLFGPYWIIKLKNIVIKIYVRGSRLRLTYHHNENDCAGDYDIQGKNPISVVNSILEADAQYPDLLARLKDIEREYNKFQKVRNISEQSISMLVRDKFGGSGLRYNLTLQPTRVLLRVKLRRGRFFEVTLPHDKFSDILTDNLVCEIRQVAESVDRLGYEIRVARHGSREKWVESE